MSIREYGVLQPDRRAAAGRSRHGEPQYELIMGERRSRAPPQAAGLAAHPGDRRATPPTRPCCATRCWRTSIGRSSTRSRRPRPTSSCSRTSASPRSRLAERIGRSRPQITNTLRLLQLPEAIQHQGRRRRAHRRSRAGHPLRGEESGDAQRLADKIVNEDLSVRAAEAAAGMLAPAEARSASKPVAGPPPGSPRRARGAPRRQARHPGEDRPRRERRARSTIDFATVGRPDRRILAEQEDSGVG